MCQARCDVDDGVHGREEDEHEDDVEGGEEDPLVRWPDDGVASSVASDSVQTPS